MESIPSSESLVARLEELRVKAHLAGMDARDELEVLRHEIHALGTKASRKAKQAARSILDRMRDLEASLVVPD